MENKVEKSPSQALGEEIVKALIEENLLTKDAAKTFQTNLIAGRIKESDWKVELESALKKEEKNGK
ncbi:MAG TPA: hypothetical protein VLB84_05015 [Bacteroidia bacterium]|nr:hypothetical protein [Bacteroidia bacterium]